MLRRSLVLVLTLIVAVLMSTRSARASDPTTADCLAASETSLVLRSQHKLRATREQLLVCAARTCPEDVRNECARRVEDVNRAMPTIVFEAKDGAGNDLGSVRVTMDGQLLVERLDGVAVPLDPGEHTFTFEAVGLPPIEKVLIVREGEKERRERVILGAAETHAEADAATGASPPTTDLSEPLQPLGGGLPSQTPPSSGSQQRTLGLIAAGAGVVALGAGAILGLNAQSAKSTYTQHCGGAIGAPPGYCDSEGVSAHDRASSNAMLSTGFFVAGSVALAAGAALYFTAPKASVSAALGVAPGSVVVRAQF